MAVFGWIALQIGVQAIVGFFFIDRVGKGRLLSRPMWRFPFYRPRISPYTGRILATWTRLAQLLTIFVPYEIVAFTRHIPLWGQAIYALVVIALYLDDYLTGDDDKWRRFKSFARNAVRWKMALPKPVTDA